MISREYSSSTVRPDISTHFSRQYHLGCLSAEYTDHSLRHFTSHILAVRSVLSHAASMRSAFYSPVFTVLAPVLVMVAVMCVLASASSTARLPVVRPSSAAAASPPRVLVSLGQSNNQGEGCCYNATVDAGFPNMVQYVIDDGASDWQYTDDIHNHTHQLTRATEPMYDGGSNRASIIGNLVALGRLFGNVGDTVLVQAAISGTSITQWLSGGLLARAVQAASNATALVSNAPITLFTWIQGESDAGRSTSAYLEDLITVIAIARNSTPGASPTTPFILGSMVPEWVAGSPSVWPILEAHRLLPNLVPHTAYQQMPQGYVDCVEGIHYSATGQRLMAALIMEALTRAEANVKAGHIPSHPSNLTITSNSSHVVLRWVAAAPHDPTAAASVDGYLVRWKYYDRPENLGTYPHCPDLDASAPHSFRTDSTDTKLTLDKTNFNEGGTWQFAVFAVKDGQISSGRYDSYVLHDILAPSQHWLSDSDDVQTSSSEEWWLLVVAAIVLVLSCFVLCLVRFHRLWTKQRPLMTVSLVAASTPVMEDNDRLMPCCDRP